MDAIHSITIEYLANTGFLLCGGGHKLLVDAVFSRRALPFSAMPSDLLESILRAEGHFADTDLFLFTHCHPDHCEPGDLLRLQEPGVCVIVPEDARATLSGRAAQKILYPVEEGGVIWEDETLRITAIPTRHDRAEDVSPTIHYSYLLEFKPENICVLVMGDAETGPHCFDAWLAGKKLSAMTINFVEINQEKGRAFLRETDPGTALLCHLPLPEDDQYHMAKLALRNLQTYQPELPPCVLCQEPHTIITIGSKTD